MKPIRPLLLFMAAFMALINSPLHAQENPGAAPGSNAVEDTPPETKTAAPTPAPRPEAPRLDQRRRGHAGQPRQERRA